MQLRYFSYSRSCYRLFFCLILRLSALFGIVTRFVCVCALLRSQCCSIRAAPVSVCFLFAYLPSLVWYWCIMYAQESVSLCCLHGIPALGVRYEANMFQSWLTAALGINAGRGCIGERVCCALLPWIIEWLWSLCCDVIIKPGSYAELPTGWQKRIFFVFHSPCI